MEYTMKITKTVSTLSLAAALVAAAVVLTPSDAAAGGFKSQTKVSAKVGGGQKVNKSKTQGFGSQTRVSWRVG
jgi:hypothetical protein